MTLPVSISNALARITRHGFEAYAVGGCVRDALMGIRPNDFDITTDATPDEVKRIFSDVPVIETGIEHGTVTVLLDSHPFEITTYRIDGEYFDRRRPSTVAFTRSIQEDLSRRDFTINAMAYSPETGIVDPFNGQKDLAEKRIRCVGDPLKRFAEDALRILRAVRFASVLGFDIESKTKEALLKLKESIREVAMERITAEFSKMICGDCIGAAMIAYAPVLGVFLPEILPTIQFQQNNPYHAYDVYTHTMTVVANVPPRLSLRIAAFFHDIAKPMTYTEDEKGIGHFYGHQKRSAEVAKIILDRMRFDNETKKRALDLIFYHDVQIRCETKSVKRVLNRFSEDFFIDLIALKKADVLGQHPNMRDRITALDRLLVIYQDILKDHACFSLKDLAIHGDDLIAAGLPQGRKIGLILHDCLDQVISEKVPNTREDLLQYVTKRYE